MRRRALQRYGINNKNDLVALSRYCQGVVARDMQPQFAI
jgi:hypothetical protein